MLNDEYLQTLLFILVNCVSHFKVALATYFSSSHLPLYDLITRIVFVNARTSIHRVNNKASNNDWIHHIVGTSHPPLAVLSCLPDTETEHDAVIGQPQTAACCGWSQMYINILCLVISAYHNLSLLQLKIYLFVHRLDIQLFSACPMDSYFRHYGIGQYGIQKNVVCFTGLFFTLWVGSGLRRPSHGACRCS